MTSCHSLTLLVVLHTCTWLKAWKTLRMHKCGSCWLGIFANFQICTSIPWLLVQFRTVELKSSLVAQSMKNCTILTKNKPIYLTLCHEKCHIYTLFQDYLRNCLENLLQPSILNNNQSSRHFLDVWGLVLVIVKELPMAEMQTIPLFA